MIYFKKPTFVDLFRPTYLAAYIWLFDDIVDTRAASTHFETILKKNIKLKIILL